MVKFKQLQRLPPTRISEHQSMLQEMFSGNDWWGTGRNLPVINHALNSGNGLIKCEDEGITRSFFGF